LRKYKQCRNQLNAFVKEYAGFGLLMVLFNLTCAAKFYWQGDWTAVKENLLSMGQQLCLSWLLLLVLTMLLCWISWHGIGEIILRGWLIVSGLLFAVDIFLLSAYHSLLDKAMLQIVLATNMHETMEFLGLRFRDILTAAGALGIALLLSRLWQYAVRKFLQDTSNLPAVFMLLLFVGGSWVQYSNSEVIEYCLSVERASDMFYCLYDEVKNYDEISHGLASQRIQLTYNNSTIPYVVFILGESTSRHHMSIYGYELDTTPLLQAREAAGELQIFNDVVSPHTYTMAVLRELFTFYRKGDEGEWFNYSDYFDILRAAGYHTAWISNQESSGIYGNVGRAYADRCDEKAFTVVRDSENDISRYDEAVLPLLDTSLGQNTAEKSFYVVHLMGTHEDYIRRYPPEYDVFNAAEETGSKPEWRKIRAEYDNAVRYNDFVVDEIIRRFENKNAIVIYISDHGEEVYDTWGFRGHAEHGSFYQLEIPMLIWTSAEFRQAYPDTMQKISEAVDKPFMTNDMLYMLMALMHVETMEFKSERSPLDPSFDVMGKRMYEGSEYRHTP